MSAWIFQSSTADGTPILMVVIVVMIATLFGMLSSLARVQEREGPRAIRQLLLNAGAVWITALAIALQLEASLPLCALIGLGIGLAGSAALEVVERGTIAIANRILGIEGIVTKPELDERIGEVRQSAQIAMSEANLRIKQIEKPGTSTGFDDPEI